MRVEDDPITLKKKKACHPLCRRQSVITKRENLQFADFCRALKKQKDTIL